MFVYRIASDIEPLGDLTLADALLDQVPNFIVVGRDSYRPSLWFFLTAYLSGPCLEPKARAARFLMPRP
jgi:hypothetical protein